MSERYLPPSDFLQAIIDDNVTFGDHDFGETNLLRLMEMTRDREPANRDWAIMLLSQLELDRPDVRETLIGATSDKEPAVRAEALLGIAMLDRAVALPLVKRELAGDVVNMPLLEAAILVADPSLADDLAAFSAPSSDPMLDRLVNEAIEACRSAP
ncbi:MAG: lyase [Novosphingobium sp.]|nr:lyase [Novosphingobium sp.]